MKTRFLTLQNRFCLHSDAFGGLPTETVPKTEVERINQRTLLWYNYGSYNHCKISKLLMSFLKSYPLCEGTLPALNHLDYQSDGKRTPLWDRGRLGNDHQWVPGFMSRCSWMFPERLRNKSELAGSEEIHQAYTKHPKCGTPSG